MTNERIVQAQIMYTLGSLPDVRIFRNNNGLAYCGTVVHEEPNRIILSNHWRVKFGLFPGSADLIGIKRVRVAPEMVGCDIGQFVSIEVKSAAGTEKKDQENWRFQMGRMGALAGIARSVDDAREICGV